MTDDILISKIGNFLYTTLVFDAPVQETPSEFRHDLQGVSKSSLLKLFRIFSLWLRVFV